MGTMPFAQLGRGLYRPEDCITTRHFWERAAKRQFPRAALTIVLREGDWHPDDVQHDCWKILTDLWEIVVRIEEETPILITAKCRAKFTRSAA